jgi:hypothetical protein
MSASQVSNGPESKYSAIQIHRTLHRTILTQAHASAKVVEARDVSARGQRRGKLHFYALGILINHAIGADLPSQAGGGDDVEGSDIKSGAL